MATREREVKVTVLGDSRSGQRALADLDDHAQRVDSRFDGLGTRLASFGKVAALGLAGAAVGVGAFLKSSVEAAEESRKVMAQTDAVIKSTGGVARVTAADVDKLASSLSAMSGVDDEVIAGGQNLLLTFTNVRNAVGKGNDIFNQGTKAALDMSVALGTDMNSASMLVGKALNDPIKGMTALTRSGIQFTKQQKDQVEAMVKSGDVMGAQKIILKELETQFGGSAEAAASPMARLKVVVGNLQEELGARLLPVISRVATFLADKLPGAIDKVTGLFSGLFSLFAKGDYTGSLGKALGIEEDSPIVDTMFKIRDAIMGAVGEVVGWVKDHWPEIKKIITDTMKTIQAVVKGVVEVLTTIWENFGDQIIDVAKAAWRFVHDTIEGALRVIQGIVKVITGIIKGDWGQVWEGIKQIVSGAWEVIKARIDLALNLIKNIISVALEIVKSTFSDAWNGVFEVTRNILAAVVDTFLGAADLIISTAAKAFGWIPGLGGKLREAADWFHSFREEANAAIRGIQGEIEITADATRFWQEYNYAASVARRGIAIETQTDPGITSAGPQRFARGLEVGPVKGPAGAAVPIIARAGEWVVTPEQMAQLRGGSTDGAWAGGPGITLGPGAIVVYALDPKGAALAVRDELIGYGKRVPSLGLS